MKAQEAKSALIVFVRFPAPGKVKSRLAEGLGEEQAASFYRACAEKTFRECEKVDGAPEKYIFYSDAADEQAVREWVGPMFHFAYQKGENLGERLANALCTVFAAGVKKVVVMASDVPDLDAGILDEALKSLSTYNIVIGPASDVVYYLLGMKKMHEEMFKGIAWSTEEVLGQTLKAAGELGLRVKRLPILRDIDTDADLRAWLRTTGAGKPLLKSLNLEGYKLAE